MKKQDVIDLIEKLNLDGSYSTYDDEYTYEFYYNGISYEMNLSDKEGILIKYTDDDRLLFCINNIVKCGKSKSGERYMKLSSKHYENIFNEIKKEFKHKYRTLVIESLDE